MHACPLASDWFCLDPDFHVMPEGIEETEETIGGEAAQTASGKSRYFGLIDVENLGGLRLRETAGLNDAGDLPGQFRLGKRLVRAIHPDVSEDVTFAFSDVAIAHDDRPLPAPPKLVWCSRASLRRDRII